MSNALALGQEFIDAWLAHDGDLFVIPAFPRTPPEYHGKEQVSMFVHGFMPGFRGEFDKLGADGDKMTFWGRLTSDAVIASGVDYVEQNDEIVFVNGKIKTFTIRFTPKTIEKFK